MKIKLSIIVLILGLFTVTSCLENASFDDCISCPEPVPVPPRGGGITPPPPPPPPNCDGLAIGQGDATYIFNVTFTSVSCSSYNFGSGSGNVIKTPTKWVYKGGINKCVFTTPSQYDEFKNFIIGYRELVQELIDITLDPCQKARYMSQLSGFNTKLDEFRFNYGITIP